jgi:hypothetical protein
MYFCSQCRGVHPAQAEGRAEKDVVLCSRYRSAGQMGAGKLTLHDHIRACERVRGPLEGSSGRDEGWVGEVTCVELVRGSEELSERRPDRSKRRQKCLTALGQRPELPKDSMLRSESCSLASRKSLQGFWRRSGPPADLPRGQPVPHQCSYL